MSKRRTIRLLGVLALLGTTACASGAVPAEAPTPAPTPAATTPTRIAIRPGATDAPISQEDLRLRLSIFAHDSMEGRASATAGHERAVAYIAGELARLGVQPAGHDGSYFQAVPLRRREVVADLTVAGEPAEVWTDFAPYDHGGSAPALDSVRVVFGGNLGTEEAIISPAEVVGRVVVFTLPDGAGAGLLPADPSSILSTAAALVITNVDSEWDGIAGSLKNSQLGLRPEPGRSSPQGPLQMFAPAAVVARWLGKPLSEAAVGDVGGLMRGSFRYEESSSTSNNVIGIIPGSDPELRGEMVAIGAHSDHDGFSSTVFDHDSLRASARAAAEDEGEGEGDFEGIAIAAPSRADSIFNGADDDASGSMALLEMAEAFAHMEARPRRSILLIWHTAEELGLLGSEYFTDHPTVDREEIIALINIDMIGRGSSDDLEEGGDQYLQILGSRRISSELGDLVEEVNSEQCPAFELDYQFDTDGHPEQFYCRSDHFNYARYGIPIAFFSTGDHIDYHQVTDESQYIDYPHLRRVTQFVFDVVSRVAGLDLRLAVDQEIPPLGTPCQQ